MADPIEAVPPGSTVVHEPHGFIRLVDSAATDLMVVNAARVSFARESAWDAEGMALRLRGDDDAVLRYLLRNRHGTPFEHTFFRFHIRAPIFVFRGWHRHRIGISINEESARYTELKPDFYVPKGEHWRKQVGRPGAYTYEPFTEGIDTLELLIEGAYREVWECYQELLARGVAREIARCVLPVGIYSQMYWTCNARSLMAFLSLRAAPDAQREIRDYAQALERVLAEQMPTTYQAFVENGRVAP